MLIFGKNADSDYDGVVLEILVFWSLWLVPDAESEYDGVVLGSANSEILRRLARAFAQSSKTKVSGCLSPSVRPT